MICLSPTSPRKIRNDGEAVTPPPFLNPTTMKGSGESMGKANNVKLSLEVQATKVCTKCGEEKSVVEFYRRRQREKNGIKKYQAKCIACAQAYKQANKEHISKRNKQYNIDNAEHYANYRKENKDRILQVAKEYRANNQEKIKEAKRKDWAENREKLSARSKIYRQENADVIKARKAAAYKRDIEKIKARRTTPDFRERANARQRDYRKRNPGLWGKYCGDRAKTDPIFRMHKLLRSRQRLAIQNKQKKGSAVRDIGCNGEELKSHIESLFDARMTWENAGSYWHLDHIFPLAKANMENRVEYLAVSNWRNLQPLEAKANIAKGDKVTPAARRLFNKLVKEFS